MTFRDLLIAIGDYLRYFLRRWYWLVLGVALGVGYFVYTAKTTAPTYVAELSFLLNENKQSGIGASAILGSLGLGGGDGSTNTSAKMLQLAKSRRVLTEVLFDTVQLAGDRDLIANHMLDLYRTDLGWDEREELASFRFTDVTVAPEDRVANSVLKGLYGTLIKRDDGLLEVTSDDLSGMFTIKTVTLSPQMSIDLAEGVYQHLSDYYVTSTVADKRKTLDLLTHRADSIQTELEGKEVQLAATQDRSLGIPLRRGSVREQRLSREILILSTMYAEVVKNQEAAAFLLANQRPLFNLVDAPVEPLRTNRESIVMAVILGVLTGLLTVGTLLFVVKLVKDTLHPEPTTSA